MLDLHVCMIYFMWSDRMSDVTERTTYPFVERRDKVLPDMPADSEKEHLSIVNCGHRQWQEHHH